MFVVLIKVPGEPFVERVGQKPNTALNQQVCGAGSLEQSMHKYGLLPERVAHLIKILKKMLNELYRLTSCKNFLKESLGTRPRRPPK